MTTENSNIFIPLDQNESAKHFNIDTLLPQKIYKELGKFVSNALTTASQVDQSTNSYNPDDHRSHHAILVAGSRGTGKSSVLVNLAAYLKKKDRAGTSEHDFKDVHILRPVDPTLLDDHDSLFLNVIVAAVLSDPCVIERQERHPEKCRELHQALYELGTALDNSESYKMNKGIDKLRNFVGKAQVIYKVHQFFSAVLKVLGKKLLVITIDDVDTSLNQAFENLEVVRRYLMTPYVLPIISGDLNLYHDITCRDFHGRLLADSSYQRNAAWERADNLAQEYLRKLLPFPRRLNMPEVSEYLEDKNIKLHESEGNNSSEWWSLACFHAWLTALHSGPVNGLENSRLTLPIPSVRALTQIIGRFANLEQHLWFRAQAADTMNEIRKLNRPNHAARSWQMHGLDAAIENFRLAYKQASHQDKRDYSSAYRTFVKTLDETPSAPRLPWLNPTQFARPIGLKEHWKSEPEGGACYLILQALEHWKDSSFNPVFKTPLFDPLSQQGPEFDAFFGHGDLLDWPKKLAPYMPEEWLERLPSKAILPYPVPEVGSKVALSWKFWSADEEKREKKRSLLLALLHHRNFYDNAKRSGLICIGRIVELTITSLIRDVLSSDIEELLLRPPYYSTADLAPTKTQKDDTKDESKDAASENAHDEPDIAELLEHLNEEIEELATAIGTWRNSNRIPYLSPWLVYNVLNKTFNQAWIFNPRMPNNHPKEADTVAWIARQAYYSVWAAFGSFEKGPLFGLPLSVATTNIGDGQRFENSELFKLNISPFWKKGDDNDPVRKFGRETRSITYLLGEHPLREWVEALNSPAKKSTPSGNKAERISPIEREAQEFLHKKMGKKGKPPAVEGGLYPTERQANYFFRKSGEDQARAIVDELNKLYSKTETAAHFARLFAKCFNNSPKIVTPSKPE
ncbi:antiviral RADAR system adenosine triphosphatase RdrA [Zoogloea ramigera]|uniref:antiviral RADAR system adenosine triphosphatase RdrA n=1 Tax=Zoogloea ramigera TaxID=350 RepID=UPI003FA2FBFB